jgi:hypothetical protein
MLFFCCVRGYHSATTTQYSVCTAALLVGLHLLSNKPQDNWVNADCSLTSPGSGQRWGPIEGRSEFPHRNEHQCFRRTDRRVKKLVIQEIYCFICLDGNINTLIQFVKGNGMLSSILGPQADLPGPWVWFGHTASNDATKTPLGFCNRLPTFQASWRAKRQFYLCILPCTQ